MTRYFLTLTSLLIFLVVGFGQRKLILYNSQQSYIFKIGDELGITTKEKPFIFSNWKTICKPCDTIVQKNLWTIDSITEKSFVLSQIASYRFDTLTYDDYISLVNTYKKEKKSFPLIESTFFSDTLIGMEKQEMCVIKFPIVKQQTVDYDSLESITFSRLKSEEYCSKAYIIIPAMGGLLGVYLLFSEGVKRYPDKRTIWIGIGSVVSGAILTKISRDIHNNNVETINMEYYKIKIR